MGQTPPRPEAVGQVSDAVTGNWVDTAAPVPMRPYLRLSRADRPIGTWLLLLPCWWGLLAAMLASDQARWFDFWIFMSTAIGAFLMRGAGCTWNDITDRNFDGAVERTRSRPIPSGQVTVKQALAWMILQAALGAVILFSYNMLAIGLGILSLGLVGIYPFAKRFTWWPQVFLGLAFNWGGILVYAAHAGHVGLAAFLLYFCGISWTLFYDTIYAHQDKEDDALIGVKSTARLFGDASVKWLYFFGSLAVLFMAWAVLDVTQDRSTVSRIVAFLAVPSFAGHMAWQMSQISLNNTAVLLRLFRSNRDAGLLPVLFFACALVL